MYFSKSFDMVILKIMDLIMFADPSDHCEHSIGRLASPKVPPIPFVRRRGRSFCLNVVIDEYFMLFI